MNYEVKMPSLGADMESGKLMEWRIRPGDIVKKGQTIAVVETTKSAVEIESYRNGKVVDLVGEIGQNISVGKPIAHFEVEGASQEVKQEKRLKISPAAWRFAQEHNVSLSDLTGTGTEEEIQLKDVENALSQSKGSTSIVNLRTAIAQATSLSKKEIPHYYLKTRLNLDSFMSWLDKVNQKNPAEMRLLPIVAFMRAIVMSFKDCPSMNGHFEQGNFKASESIHLSTTIALKEGGVLVPAILDAQNLTLLELQRSFEDLVVRTRRSELKNRELTEGTFTITNIGDLGVDEVFGVIFPPQVAMLGLGQIRKAPMVVGEKVTSSWVVDVTLSADHRVSDGIEGAHFLRKIEEHLLQPELLGEV